MHKAQVRGIFFVLFAAMMVLGMVIKNGQKNTVETVRQGTSDTAKLPPRVALTFDDGPHPVYTKKLLEGLKKRGVTATFFVVGGNIVGHEELIAQMEKDGHLIGNHTYDHCNMAQLADARVCEELEKTSALVESITGKKTAYVRPPFGNWKESLDQKTSMIPVKWTLDTKDWTTANVSEIVNRVVTDVSDSDIILLHDFYESSVNAALEIVDILLEKGYQFVTVEELILE